MRRIRKGILIAGLGVAVAATATPAAAEEIIRLTQTACQFLEPEGADHGFKSTRKEDCERINAGAGEKRLDGSTTLTLEPGTYVFRVSNRDVPYPLGFWFRSAGYDWRNPVHKLTKTSVSGGGLERGMTKDYRITLEAGEYVYSCPLNPTPDYRVVVSGG